MATQNVILSFYWQGPYRDEAKREIASLEIKFEQIFKLISASVDRTKGEELPQLLLIRIGIGAVDSIGDLKCLPEVAKTIRVSAEFFETRSGKRRIVPIDVPIKVPSELKPGGQYGVYICNGP